MNYKNNIKTRSLGQVPIVGSSSYNTIWYLAIGGLAVNWANNESVFLAMLQVLIAGGKRSALLVWHSHRTSRARLELVEKLCREQVKDIDLLTDIQKAISQFNGFSRVRNFYCHAMYRYDSELRLVGAAAASTPPEGEPIVFEERRLDKKSMNELKETIMRLAGFNLELWRLVARLQTALGVQRVTLPELPPEPTANQDDQARPEMDETPEGTQ